MKKLLALMILAASTCHGVDRVLGNLSDLTWTGAGATRVASFSTIPRSLSPSLWFDASDASTYTTGANSTVLTWADKSGNSYLATQTNAAWRPVVSNYNGFTVINFDGVSQRLDLSAWTTTAFTVCAVIRPREINSTHVVLGNSAGANYGPNAWIALSGDYLYSHSPGSGSTYYWQGAYPATNLAIAVTAKYDGTNGQHKINRAIRANNNSGTAGGAMAFTKIGARLGGSAWYHNGAIMEVLAWNRAISSNDVVDVESYLQAKWSTP
jgi:hypothetical protein